MNPGTPFCIGSESSSWWGGVGARPTKPFPLKALKSAELTTVRNDKLSMQWDASALKQILSWAGCPRTLPLPYWRAWPAFSFSLNDWEWDWRYLPFFFGHLFSSHFSENTQARADPVSKMTCISYDGLPNQNLPSYPMFLRLSRSMLIGVPKVF